MRIFYRLTILLLSVFFVQSATAQSGVFTGLNGTVINVPCANNCNALKVKVPHLKSSSDYTLVSIPYRPFAYVTATGTELTSLYADDRYSSAFAIGFPFCFYDSTYNNAVVGSNGLLTFDVSQSNRGNSYQTTQPIPYAGGVPNATGTTYYPPASVMAIFTDLNPAASASLSDRKIECRVEGTAPFRRFIASYYNVGTFGANFCTQSSPTTFQIVLYEQTGLIDYFIEDRTCQSSTAQGKAIMGIQNWQRNKAVAAPGRNSVAGWTASHEGWRFVPSGTASRFVRAEIYDLAGVLLNTTTPADTTTTTPGLLDINFNNICFTGASKQFVIKTYYSSCPSGNPLMSNDTITVSKGNLTAGVSSTAAGCNANGTATITLPAGSAPYNFSIGSNAPVTSNNNSYTFTGLIAGSYTLTATNAAGCSATSTVTVALNGSLNIQATPFAPACAGFNNGSIVVSPQNGTPPFQYNINNGAYQTSNTFSNLASGTYVIGARDSSGCVRANYVVNIPAPGPVTATITPSNVSCNGGNDGTASIIFNSNATPLQYSLDGITYQASNTFNGLSAGTYSAYYRDANGCGGNQNFTITQPSVLSIALTRKNVTCNGQSTGEVTVTASGGTAGYQYSLDGNTYQASNKLSAAAGNYTVYVRDAAGCVTTAAVTIDQPTLLTLAVQTQNASCDGGADGEIAATAGGGTGGYQYSIDGINFQTAGIFKVIKGNYTVSVKDANGCIAAASANVGLTNNLTLSVAADTTICEGSSATLHAASNATQLLWSHAASLNNAAIANPVATPTDTTSYVLTATLGACSVTDTMIVNVIPAPVPGAGMNNEICFGQGYQLQGSGGTEYEWSPVTYFNNGNNASTQNPAITPSQTITYSLMVTNARGCKSLSPATVTIIVTPPIKVIAFPVDTVVARGDVIRLRASSAVNDYIWSPGFGLDNASNQNPVATIDRDIDYIVTAYTGAGCKGTDTVKIKVYNGPEIYVPGAFTPNGDGKNELLMPFPVGIKELRFFKVYNRWGQLVFETKTLSRGWDGKLNGILQPLATYVWVLEAVTKENKVIQKKGTSTLIR